VASDRVEAAVAEAACRPFADATDAGGIVMGIATTTGETQVSFRDWGNDHADASFWTVRGPFREARRARVDLRQAVASSECAEALLSNGSGRYVEALAAARRAFAYDDLDASAWGLTELIEAAARSGRRGLAAAALRRLAEHARANGTDWALGIEARSRALLSEGELAESLYQDAIERLGRSRARLDLARAQLLYGEWLRRESRRVDARQQLRAAHEVFRRIDADGFAERARRELLATGETLRTRGVERRDELTAREALIARLTGEGHTNAEIGTELFISPRTVEWHLRKVFLKLGISSRRQVRRALRDAEREGKPG
jgi:DNA-binding CsgD family transcriptional regulator